MNSLVFDFEHTGEHEIFNPPKKGVYLLEVWGSKGGDAGRGKGGKGGYTRGAIALKLESIVEVRCGGISYNGGGVGGNTKGGGATDIRVGGSELENRVIVAGGGGGGGCDNPTFHGGDGGGLKGQKGDAGRGGNVGGTQTEGYSLGYGENAIKRRGGGGGGYYGGFAGDSDWAGGGGGSGYYNGVLDNEYRYTEAGVNNGLGKARITYLGAIYHLVKSQNKICFLSDQGGWVNTELTEPLSQEDFEEFGMIDLNNINSAKLDELPSDGFEVITWTDDMDSTMMLEIETDPFRPIDLLNQEDEFEILTWTDSEDDVPKIELTVPEYRLIDELEKPIKILTYIEGEEIPIINKTYFLKPQLILPKNDIVLNMLDKIHHFKIYANQVGNGKIRIIFSVDSGGTWLTFNSAPEEFAEIDINNVEELKENGIAPDIFNTIDEKWNDVVKSQIRFAYYIEQENVNDIAEVDKLEVKMDLQGRWKKAKHDTDYDYEYDNEHIYISFATDGSYKINYQG